MAGKFGVPEEERAQLKLDLEEQTRDEIQCRSVTINNFSDTYCLVFILFTTEFCFKNLFKQHWI